MEQAGERAPRGTGSSGWGRRGHTTARTSLPLAFRVLPQPCTKGVSCRVSSTVWARGPGKGPGQGGPARRDCERRRRTLAPFLGRGLQKGGKASLFSAPLWATGQRVC